MEIQALFLPCYWRRILAGAAIIGAMTMGCDAAPTSSSIPTITSANVPCVFYRAAGQRRFTIRLCPNEYAVKQERDGNQTGTFLILKTAEPLYCGYVLALPAGTLVACSQPFDWSGRLLARFVAVPLRPLLSIFPPKPKWTPAQGIANLRTGYVKFSEIARPGNEIVECPLAHDSVPHPPLAPEGPIQPPVLSFPRSPISLSHFSK